ncbi:hypothetical protein GPECTOR_2g1349 [Gonium pectorale]|uniref:Uncharacterized protein n=1 Tax=Gonium pectorale TaxID=33097 RepID=A0A150H0Z6_GONPE|nr:hypothetical protein GPECTOR_2g1349 [Gonium pectorale]|eukprot:KXZ55799.1 hypothetical protein GPECTOR_2g1349 [Gonium pectorale]
MERQHASMRRTISEQQEALGDKSKFLEVLQSQLEEAKARLEAHAATGTVDAAVAREQVFQEERNRKALELLVGKDNRIKELEDQTAALQRANERLHVHLSEVQERLQASEAQVMGLLHQKEALAEAARAERQAADNSIAELEARLAIGDHGMTAELQLAREVAANAEDRLRDMQHMLLVAEERASKAEALVQDLKADQRLFRQTSDDHVDTALAMPEVADLEAKISELIVEAATAHTAAAASKSTDAAPRRPESGLRGASGRSVADLEAQNARLLADVEGLRRGQQLEAVHRSMVGSALEHERLQQELDSAHATAAKLNARISDLVLAEQVARAEVDAAKAKLGQLQDMHSAELSYLQQQLQRLADHMAATQPEVRAAREEGSLRIKTLEESVSRLGARGGDAVQALARSASEADAAVRRESRLRSELALVQQAAKRANIQVAELRDAKAASDLEAARLQQQLAESSRELDMAAERLAACERDVAAKEDAAARKAIEVRAAMEDTAGVQVERMS